MTPKVFISHASEDKSRFVVDFATKLRENGVDAWLDRWEMLPGDSLIGKIFEEGLKEANAVVIVLSLFSVSKPWVTEELNAGIVARISKGTKMIPVVIDDCEVPEALKSTLWERVENLNNYDIQLKRILASIFDVRKKPVLGKPPEFVCQNTQSINDLSVVDTFVLKRSGTFALQNNEYVIEPEKVFLDAEKLGISKSQILDSIEILGSDGYLNVSHFIGGAKKNFGCHYRFTNFGFERYAESEIDGYEKLKLKCAGLIVNLNVLDNKALAKHTEVPIRLINHVLDVFEANDLIKVTKSLGGNFQIYHVSAKLGRMLA